MKRRIGQSLLNGRASSALLGRISSAAAVSAPPPTSSFAMQRSSRRTFLSLLTPPKATTPELQNDLDHAVHLVRSHDPAGYLPGKLLPTPEMQLSYFAVRSFWIETGLRFGTTAKVPPNSTPEHHLEWWRGEIEEVYSTGSDLAENPMTDFAHPTLRLLQTILRQQGDTPWTKCNFDDILKGRFRDLDLKQYPDLDSLEQHAVWSCGSLSQLILESDGIFETDHPTAHKAAKLVGTCHGLTNALRTSIPVISTTGKLVIPHDLCVKYDIKSPRYLLSALGMGDERGILAMRNAVRDIVDEARSHLQSARELRQEIIETSGPHAVAVLLPGLASETFLYRLEEHDYDLTNRDLRNVNTIEHAKCAGQMILASQQNQY